MHARATFRLLNLDNILRLIKVVSYFNSTYRIIHHRNIVAKSDVLNVKMGSKNSFSTALWSYKSILCSTLGRTLA